MAQPGSRNRSQHEQGDRGRSSKSVNDPHDQWAQIVIEGQAPQPTVDPGERCLVVAVTVAFGAVPMRMLVA